MAKENSFDIVSKTDYAELANALNQTEKEISQRFDFKGSKAAAVLQGKDLQLEKGIEVLAASVAAWEQRPQPPLKKASAQGK